MTFKKPNGYWARFRANRPESETKEYKDWRKAVFARDGHACVLCGKKKSLRAHHLFSWSSHPKLRYMESNGVTLCNFCHMLFHNIYGRGKNSPQQFYNFRRRYKAIIAFEKKMKKKK
jgi:hypothetical protein